MGCDAGKVMVATYDSTDCSGGLNGALTDRRDCCTGGDESACNEEEDSGLSYYYTPSKCAADAVPQAPGVSPTPAPSPVPTPEPTKATADSSIRMSGNRAGGLVALVAMVSLAQK